MEILQIVKHARENKEKVKVFGSSHSLSGITETDGHLISLDKFNKLIKIDHQNSSVTVESGMRLYQLNKLIWDHGLSLSTLGAISDQSIAGGKKKINKNKSKN